MFYGQQTWDPVLICGQILALQALFYLSLGSILWLLLGAPACLRPAGGCAPLDPVHSHFMLCSVPCCSPSPELTVLGLQGPMCRT